MEWKEIMQVGKVSSVNNTINFGAQKASKKNEAPVYYVQNENVLKFGLIGLGIIGAAAVTTAILKKNNSSLPEKIRELTASLSKKKTQPKEDIIIQALKGKRDADAVKLYKKYQSEAKIKSFAYKYLAGDFANKPASVHAHMCKNMEILNRTVSRGAI